MSTRRIFLMATAGAALASTARAQAKLDEKDPQAVALKYVHDASKIDPKQVSGFVAGSNCANCRLYQGKASDAWGGCPLFGTRQVAGKGWCSAWQKKA